MHGLNEELDRHQGKERKVRVWITCCGKCLAYSSTGARSMKKLI